MGILAPTGVLGADGGFASSAEERTRNRTNGKEREESDEIDKEKSTQETKYKEALEDILTPPTPPNLISQIIREGFVQFPERAPSYVVILSEGLPTWLAAVDSWNSKHIFLYCEKELTWYREHLELMTSLSAYPTVAGLARAPWIKDQLNTVFLVQGSSSFCKKMIKGLVTLGLTESNKIVLTTNQRCSGLDLKFKFVRLPHSSVGGASSATTSIGFSPGWKLPNKKISREELNVE